MSDDRTFHVTVEEAPRRRFSVRGWQEPQVPVLLEVGGELLVLVGQYAAGKDEFRYRRPTIYAPTNDAWEEQP